MGQLGKLTEGAARAKPSQKLETTPADTLTEGLEEHLPDAYEGVTPQQSQSVVARMPAAQQQSWVQRLERVQGNRYAQRVVSTMHGRSATGPPGVQTKLTVGAAGDAYEQEADQVADKVMRMPGHATPPADGEASSGQIQSQRISRAAAAGSGAGAVDSGLESQIAGMRGGGEALPETERAFFEPRLGADLSGVRVHTGGKAKSTAKNLQARAYTVGSDIAFNSGEYQPGTTDGRHLLAHELTHVVQQGGAGNLQRAPQPAVAVQEEENLAPPALSAGPQGPEAEVPAEPVAEETSILAEDGAPTAEKTSTETPSEVSAEETSEENSVASPTSAPSAAAGPTEGGGEEDALSVPTAGSGIAPLSAEADPAFAGVTQQVETVAETQQQHEPAAVESAESQGAAVPPSNDVASQAQDLQVQAMDAQQPGPFNVAAFKAALMQRIEKITPRKLKEVDKFKKKNKIHEVKRDVQQQVRGGREQAVGPVKEKVEAPPDESGLTPKPVTPMGAPEMGPQPQNIDGRGAAPKAKGVEELEMPLRQESRQVGQKMSTAGVTETQLAESNEPRFKSALQGKKQVEAQAVTDPQIYRQDEVGVLAKAQANAQGMVHSGQDEIRGSREEELAGVFGEQTATKAVDEGKRTEIATEINRLYDTTKTDVEGILAPLDAEVERRFDASSKVARQQFEDYVTQRMKAYKKKRYRGFFGKLRWLKDKLLGMPSAVNKFYTEGRDLYIGTMDTLLDEIGSYIVEKLNAAKARIAEGRGAIQAYVAQLPEDLRQLGEDAAERISGRFDDLEASVDDKQDELIDTLASRYNESLQDLDARIEELKAKNRGLIAKVVDFIKNVISTILQLAAMLVKLLLKAASAVPKIILNPIRFLRNLLKGVKQGLRNFAKNFTKHLGNGLMNWLTGTMGEMGLQMPENLDMKGILDLVLQVLGISWESIKPQVLEMLKDVFGEQFSGYAEELFGLLENGMTWDNARPIAIRMFGPRAVGYVEKAFGIFQTLRDEGIGGLWTQLKEFVGDIAGLVLDPIKDMLKQKVIKAGIDQMVGLMGGPAGAFISAVKAIVRVVKWFLEHGKKLMVLIDAVLDSILAIAGGSVDEAAQKVEQALAKVIPVVLSFLSDLLGIGSLTGTVQKVINKVRSPINKAIRWLIKQAKSMLSGVKRFLSGDGKQSGDLQPGEEEGSGEMVGEKVAFTVGEEQHHHWVEFRNGNAVAMVASDPKSVETATKEAKSKETSDPKDKKDLNAAADQANQKAKTVQAAAEKAKSNKAEQAQLKKEQSELTVFLKRFMELMEAVPSNVNKWTGEHKYYKVVDKNALIRHGSEKGFSKSGGKLPRGSLVVVHDIQKAGAKGKEKSYGLVSGVDKVQHWTSMGNLKAFTITVQPATDTRAYIAGANGKATVRNAMPFFEPLASNLAIPQDEDVRVYLKAQARGYIKAKKKYINADLVYVMWYGLKSVKLGDGWTLASNLKLAPEEIDKAIPGTETIKDIGEKETPSYYKWKKKAQKLIKTKSKSKKKADKTTATAWATWIGKYETHEAWKLRPEAKAPEPTKPGATPTALKSAIGDPPMPAFAVIHHEYTVTLPDVGEEQTSAYKTWRKKAQTSINKQTDKPAAKTWASWIGKYEAHEIWKLRPEEGTPEPTKPGAIPAALKKAIGDPPTPAFAIQSATYTFEDHPLKPGHKYLLNTSGVADAGSEGLDNYTDQQLKTMFANAGIPTSDQGIVLKVVRAVSGKEGGFDAVNTYDAGRVSIGFIQFISAKNGTGSLANVMGGMKVNSPQEFKKYLQDAGLDVKKGQIVICDPSTGEVLLKGVDAVNKIIADKRLTAYFHHAGKQSQGFKVAQIREMYRSYYLANKRFHTLKVVSLTKDTADKPLLEYFYGDGANTNAKKSSKEMQKTAAEALKTVEPKAKAAAEEEKKAKAHFDQVTAAKKSKTEIAKARAAYDSAKAKSKKLADELGKAKKEDGYAKKIKIKALTSISGRYKQVLKSDMGKAHIMDRAVQWGPGFNMKKAPNSAASRFYTASLKVLEKHQLTTLAQLASHESEILPGIKNRL